MIKSNNIDHGEHRDGPTTGPFREELAARLQGVREADVAAGTSPSAAESPTFKVMPFLG